MYDKVQLRLREKRMNRWAIVLSLVVVLAEGVTFAEDAPTLEEVMAQLRQLQKTVAQQQEQIAELTSELDDAKSLAAPTEALKDEHVRALIRQELVARPAAGMPAWADGLKFGGKMRLRYEGIYGRNGVYGQALGADAYGRPRWGPAGLRGRGPNNRMRTRYALWFGFEKDITEELMIGFRLASGVGGAQNANVTMGDGFNADLVWIDRAFMEYKPAAVPGLTIMGGKMPNKWEVVGGNIMWDTDVQPEGFQVRYDLELSETVDAWAQAGYLIIMENDAVNANGRFQEEVDALAYQLGTKVDLTEDVTLTGAVSYFDFMNMDSPTALGLGAGQWYGGNLLGQDSGGANRIAEDFDIVAIDAELGFKLNDLPCSVFGQYLNNTGTSRGNHEDSAWVAGVRVNKIKQKGDWAASLKYHEVERDAVIAGFAEWDPFLVNYRGTTGKLTYRVFDNTDLSGKVYCIDSMTGDSDSVVRSQVDVTVKF